ncbi:hypothetical protein PR048_016097 [Dryococelus australis]|uniref:Uncharacterized protein n=1 Tax=Dryococelus australis TaxID=614101 RepID=A0ABQ9HIY6_9NEOP|nr:hypothetical protein PR048_016097 [Dryococelus australis]
MLWQRPVLYHSLMDAPGGQFFSYRSPLSAAWMTHYPTAREYATRLRLIEKGKIAHGPAEESKVRLKVLDENIMAQFLKALTSTVQRFVLLRSPRSFEQAVFFAEDEEWNEQMAIFDMATNSLWGMASIVTKLVVGQQSLAPSAPGEVGGASIVGVTEVSSTGRGHRDKLVSATTLLGRESKCDNVKIAAETCIVSSRPKRKKGANIAPQPDTSPSFGPSCRSQMEEVHIALQFNNGGPDAVPRGRNVCRTLQSNDGGSHTDTKNP